MKRSHVSVLLWLLLVAFLAVSPGSEASWLDPAPVIKTYYALGVGRAPTADELEKHLIALETNKQTLFEIINSVIDSKECQDRIKDFDKIELAYLKILGRCSDGEGHESYLKKLNDEKVAIEDIEAEMANSDEGKKFAIRQIYWMYLNRDTDEPGFDCYLPSKYNAWTKGDYSAKMGLTNRIKSYPDVEQSCKDSVERQRMFSFEPVARETIKELYKVCLNREADKDGLRAYVRRWFVGMTLSEIQLELMGSEEFKKRKLDDVQTACIRHLLKAPDEALLKPYRDIAKKDGYDFAVCKMQESDDGVRILMRKMYWLTYQREGSKEELDQHVNQFKSDGRGRDRYRDWLYGFFKDQRSKDLRGLAAAWKKIADAQIDLFDTTNQAQVDWNGEAKKNFDDKKVEATKKIEELKKTLPAEFASMTYLLEKELAGLDLEKMKGQIAKISKMVEGLGPLLTGEVQKVFIQLLNRPAPDFYSALNNKTPAWEGADKVDLSAVPGNAPGAVPGNVPAQPGAANQPAIPGYEANPNDKELLPILQNLLVQAKSADDLKEKITAAIVATKEFKDLEGFRKQAIVSAYQMALSRPPTEKELADWTAKLNTGKVYITELQDFLEKSDEFKQLRDALLSGKIFPFTADEKAKADTDSKNAEAAKSGNSYRLSDIEGFKKYDWAKDVLIENAVKTDDANGFCILGDASVPLWKLKNIKVFAKQHPSNLGYRVYVAGAFFTNFGLNTLYDSNSGDEGSFLKMLTMERGVIINTSADTTLQISSLPPDVQKEFQSIIGDSGIKSIRLPEGRNVIGRLKFGEGNATKHLAKVLPDGMKPSLIQGNIPLSKSELYLRGLLPVFKPSFFPKDSKQVEPSIEFAMAPTPSVGVRLSLDFDMPEKQPMTARVSFFVPLRESGAIQLAVNIDGQWKEPFGISGLTVGNLAFTAKITVPEMSPAFGFAGDIRFGQKIIRLAAAIPASVNFSSAAFRGAINALGIEDLVSLWKDMGGQVDKLPFPADLAGLKDVDVSYATKADPVLGIPQGVCAKGLFCIKSDPVASVSAVISKCVEARGIVIKGTTKNLKLGPLQLTGDGLDGKAGTADDGAVIDILFPYGSWHAWINGRAEVFGVGRGLKILLDYRGIGWSEEYKIFNAWKSKVEVLGGFSIKSPQFNAKVEVQSDLAGDLERKLDEITGGRTPGFVKKIFSNLFNLRRAGFEGDLDKTIHGQIPGFWVEFGILGKSFNWKFDVNISDVKAAVRSLADKISPYVNDRVKEFVSEYLRAIANFFKRLFGKRKGKIDDIMAKYRENKNSYKDPDDPQCKALAEDSSWEFHYGAWSTGTNGNPGATVKMQDDGNLVIYSKDGKPLWASNTAGNPGAKLQMQDDGNLVIVKPDGKPIWASNTYGHPGAYNVMQSDGNYVIYFRK